jgi:vancomycin resistance protein YoaR
VVERSRHSSPITYLPLGLDATVAYGYKDFKFKNTHPFPIQILISVTGQVMTISILGPEKLPYDVELATQVTEIESPFPERSSESGKEVMRYRIKKRGGLVIEKEYLGRDYYHPVRGD